MDANRDEIQRVLVAGATGDTGRELVRFLAPRPVETRALTRSEAKRATLSDLGADEVVVGDLFDETDARRAVEGVDAVLSAVGSTPLAVWTGDEFVDGVGNRNLLSAAVDEGVEQFVFESALGVGDEPAHLLGEAFGALVGPVHRAKAQTETALRAAPVDHTILRVGLLTNGSRTDDVQVAPPGRKLWGPVSRADVARLMAASPFTPEATDRTFEVVSNSRVRERAVDVDWRLPGSDGGSAGGE